MSFQEDFNKRRRKIVSLCTANTVHVEVKQTRKEPTRMRWSSTLYALADDGSLWYRDPQGHWQRDYVLPGKTNEDLEEEKNAERNSEI